MPNKAELTALIAHKLWVIGNRRIGYRDWDAVADVYTAEAAEVAEAVAATFSTGEEKILVAAHALVSEQAVDDGLWFNTQTAPETYLQQELRRLHAVIEGDSRDR